MENFIDGQLLVNKIITNINKENKFSHAYMLVSSDEKTLNNISILLSKALICPNKFSLNCNKCNICKRIDKDEYPELLTINPSNNIIKKQDIIDLRSAFQTKSIEGKNQVYIVNHCECLGVQASNSILKFLEEPESNTVGIFTTNNLQGVLDTIKSRCQIVKLGGNNSLGGIEYVKDHCNCDDLLIDLAINFVSSLESDDKYNVTDNINKLLSMLESKEMIVSFMNVVLLVYFDKLNELILKKTKYFIDNDNFDKIKLNDKELITKKISYILENIQKINYNVNSLLFLSNFAIGMGEIGNGKSSRS